MLAVVAATLLIALPAQIWGTTANAAANGQTGSRRAAKYGTSGPPRTVEFRRLPQGAGRPAGQLPFHPRSSTGFKAAKHAAQSGATGRRSGVIDVKPASPPAPAGAATASASSGKGLQLGAAFPMVDRDTQVGWYGNSQNLAPPDTQLAAGPDNLVEMVNSSASIVSKSGALQGHANLYNFFQVPSGETFTDPRVQYDDGTGFWFASGLSFAVTSTTAQSAVELAVSSTADPMGTWAVYAVSVSS
ncbi:MAG: hypothetical protein E6I74_01690, partial [Chloroflexi bacterium]